MTVPFVDLWSSPFSPTAYCLKKVFFKAVHPYCPGKETNLIPFFLSEIYIQTVWPWMNESSFMSLKKAEELWDHSGWSTKTWPRPRPLQGRVLGTESSVYERNNQVPRAIAEGAQWVKCRPKGRELLRASGCTAMPRDGRWVSAQQRHLWQWGAIQVDIPEYLFPYLRVLFVRISFLNLELWS